MGVSSPADVEVEVTGDDTRADVAGEVDCSAEPTLGARPHALSTNKAATIQTRTIVERGLVVGSSDTNQLTANDQIERSATVRRTLTT